MALAMTACPSDSQEIPAREIRLFERMCDASAIEALDGTTFVVANDEDNVLRVYDWTRPGPPIRELNLNRLLPPMQGRGEFDLEGVARINDELYWISSHGRNTSGEPAPRRQALLRTPRSWFLGSVPSGGSVAVCTGLLEALFADPRYAALGLAEAAQRPPKAAGGLNIETLAAGPNGSLWIGFRNPLFEGRALMVSLLNPHSAVSRHGLATRCCSTWAVGDCAVHWNGARDTCCWPGQPMARARRPSYTGRATRRNRPGALPGMTLPGSIRKVSPDGPASNRRSCGS
jgi:hypothetical protein